MVTVKERALNLILEFLEYVKNNEENKIEYNSYFNDYTYEDSYIEIEYEEDIYPLRASIKAPLTSSMLNPVVCVNEKGEVYRCHGEHVLLLIYIILKLNKNVDDYFEYIRPEELERIKSLFDNK